MRERKVVSPSLVGEPAESGRAVIVLSRGVIGA